MPLMRPEVQAVLRKAGLVNKEKESSDSDDLTLSERLDGASLSLDETLDQLSNIARNSSNEALRLRAVEISLKAHGALKESAPQAPSFTIIIESSAFESKIQPVGTSGLNSSKDSNIGDASVLQSVNPILLPRQLLKELTKESS